MQLSLEKELTIACADSLRQQLQKLADNDDKEISIDGSAVERIDTAVLQLFVSFSKLLSGQERQLAWQDPSESLVESAEQIGLRNMLNISTDGKCNNQE
ncbi:MAG: STAS domain-containing protein [Gammaproteobacteria bacterium]